MNRARAGSLRARLLAFNLLIVALPAAGWLFLDTFERRLLIDQERTMVEQARILAAAAAAQSEGGRLDPFAVRGLLSRLGGRSEARLRVVDAAGVVLADTSALGPRSDAPGSCGCWSVDARVGDIG